MKHRFISDVSEYVRKPILHVTTLLAAICLLNSSVVMAQKTYWMGRIDSTNYVFDVQLPAAFGDAIANANTGSFQINRNPRGFESLNAGGTSYSLMKASITSDWEMFDNRLPTRSVSMVAKGGGGGSQGSWIALQNTDALVEQFARNLPQREKGKWFSAEVMILVSPDANKPSVRLPVPETTLARNKMIELGKQTLGGFFYPQVQRPTQIIPFRQAMLDYGNAGRRDPDFRKVNGSKTATDLTGDKTLVGEHNQWETVTHDNPSPPYFLDHVVNKQLTEAAQYQAEYQASIDSVTHDGPASFKGDARVKEFSSRVGYFNGPGKSFEACGAGDMGSFPHQWMVGETHFRPWFNVNGGIYQVGYGAAKSPKTGQWYYTAVISGLKSTDAKSSAANVAANNPGNPPTQTPPTQNPPTQPRPGTNAVAVTSPNTAKGGPQFETGKPLSDKSLGEAISKLTDPKFGGYTLVYDVDLAKLGAGFAYTVDNSKSIGSFDKVAYLVELSTRPANGGSVFDNYTKTVFVTMNAFTNEVMKISFPLHKETMQKSVDTMNVYSNVKGINGKGTGSMEFWANDYFPGDDNSYNNKDVPGGRDFGYGSMQFFNPRGDTVFAINGWGNGPKADIGIGNSAVKKDGLIHKDWTFANNADTYTSKRLRIYVRKSR